MERRPNAAYAALVPQKEPNAKRFVDAHRHGAGGAAGREGPAAHELRSIGELAETLGTTTRAIRFYEEKGLLAPQRVGGSRVYGKRQRARLQLILRGKALGLPLRDIKAYLDLYGERGEGRAKQLGLAIERAGAMIEELEGRRNKIDETIAELKLIQRESRKKLRALED